MIKKFLSVLFVTISVTTFAQPGGIRVPGPVIISQPGTGGTGSVSPSEVINIIEQYLNTNNLTGGIISNAYNLTLFDGIFAQHTNSTPHFALVSQTFDLVQGAGTASDWAIRIDTNANGTFDLMSVARQSAGNDSAGTFPLVMTAIMQPGARWVYTNVAGSGGVITPQAEAGTVTYFGTTSGSGGTDISPFYVTDSAFGYINTNAIVAWTNTVTDTNIFIISGCDTNAFNVAWYYSPALGSFTNSTIPGYAWADLGGGTFLTNSTHSTDSDFVYGGGPIDPESGIVGDFFFGPDGSGGVDPDMASIWGTAPSYVPRFEGIAPNAFNYANTNQVISNGWEVVVFSNGVPIKIAVRDLMLGTNNTMFVGDNFAFRSPRGGAILFQDYTHAAYPLVWIGGLTSDVILAPSPADGILQLGQSDNAGGQIYMQSSVGPVATNTLGFSHPLIFKSKAYNGGSIQPKNPGISGVPTLNDGSQHGTLNFWSIAPQFGNTTVGYLPQAPNSPNLMMSLSTNALSTKAGITIQSTNGFASFATNQNVTATATGLTNGLAMNYIAYVTAATGLSLTNSAGTVEFYGVTVAAFTPIRVQPGGKLVGTAMTYASGTGGNAW